MTGGNSSMKYEASMFQFEKYSYEVKNIESSQFKPIAKKALNLGNVPNSLV